MKKLFLMLGLACLFMVACNNAPKQEQTKVEPVATEEHHCPFCTLKAEYANWENMADSVKVALNQKAFDLFTEFDTKMAQMEAEGHACGQALADSLAAKKAACEAQCAQMKAQWANFAEMGVDEQKDLVLGRIAAMGMGKCNHEGEGHQCQHEGEGHQCQHGGEGHQCQQQPK